MENRCNIAEKCFDSTTFLSNVAADFCKVALGELAQYMTFRDSLSNLQS